MREPIPDYLRRRVFQRDGKRCRYCGKTDGEFHIDHVYPVVKGGETTLENLVVSCKGCNLSKHSKVGIWPKPVGYFDKPSRVEKQSGEVVVRIPIPNINIKYVMEIYGNILACIGAFSAILFFVARSDSMFINEKSIDMLLIIGLVLSAVGVFLLEAFSTYGLVSKFISAVRK